MHLGYMHPVKFIINTCNVDMHSGHKHHGYMHHGYMHHGYMHHRYKYHDTGIVDTCIIDSCIIKVEVEKEVLVNFVWVTRPEHPKGAKDEVKRPKRPPP